MIETKGKKLPQEALDWFQVHYPKNSFDGYFHLSYRGSKGFRTLWTGNRENMAEFLANMRVLSKSDYYISANQCSTLKRQKEALFAMQNMVIDLDCHDEDIHPEEKEVLFQCFLQRFAEFEEYIPTPHSIIWTGRGLQLWWNLEPVHASCAYFFHQAKQYLINGIKQVLEEYACELSQLTVDMTASNNVVGVYRLPGTRNATARKMVRIQGTAVEKPEKPEKSEKPENPKKPYVLQELEAFFAANDPSFYEPKSKTVEKGETGEKESQDSPKIKNTKVLRDTLEEKGAFTEQYDQFTHGILENLYTFSFFRVKQLIELRFHRNLPKGRELRNDFSLIAYSAFRATLSPEASWEKLCEFNAGFKKPMSEAELKNVICTACYKEGYRFTNEKVVEFLDISPKEQALVSIYTKADGVGFVKKASHMARSHLNKLRKEKRNADIIALYRQNTTVVEIAAKMKLSKNTVNTVTKPFREERLTTLLAKISTFLKEQKTKTEILDLLPTLAELPKRTRSRYMQLASI